MTQPTSLHFGRDDQGYNAFSPNPSINIWNATLVNGTATSILLPLTESVWTVAISIQPGSSVWVDFSGATASIPIGNTLTPATSVLNPGSRTEFSLKSDGITQNKISVITSNPTADISIEAWTVSH